MFVLFYENYETFTHENKWIRSIYIELCSKAKDENKKGTVHGDAAIFLRHYLSPFQHPTYNKKK